MEEKANTLGVLLDGLARQAKASRDRMLEIVAPGIRLSEESKELVFGVLPVRERKISKDERRRREGNLAASRRRIVSHVVGLDAAARQLSANLELAYNALLDPNGVILEYVALRDAVAMEALYETLGKVELACADDFMDENFVLELREAYARENPDDGRRPSAAEHLGTCLDACATIEGPKERCAEMMRVSLMAALMGPDGVELCRRSGDVLGMGPDTTLGALVMWLCHHSWLTENERPDVLPMYRYLSGLWRRNDSQISRILNLGHGDGWRWKREDRLVQPNRSKKQDVGEIARVAVAAGKVRGQAAANLAGLLSKTGRLQRTISRDDPTVLECVYAALEQVSLRPTAPAPDGEDYYFELDNLTGNEPWLEHVYQAYAREYAESLAERDGAIRDIRNAVIESAMADDADARTSSILRALMMGAYFGPEGLAACVSFGNTVRPASAEVRKVNIGITLTQRYGESDEFAFGSEEAFGALDAVHVGRGLEGENAFSPVGQDGTALGAVGRHHADLVPAAEGNDISWYLVPCDAKCGTALRPLGAPAKLVEQGERVRLSPGDEIWLAPISSDGVLQQDVRQGAVLVFDKLYTYWYSRKRALGQLPDGRELTAPETDKSLPATERVDLGESHEDTAREPGEAIGFSLIVGSSTMRYDYLYDELPEHHELNLDWRGVSIGRDKNNVDVPVGMYNPLAVIGRQHGRFMREGSLVLYEDYSTNGSRVVRRDEADNSRGISVRGESVELRDGDTICLPDAMPPDITIKFKYLYA